MIYSPLKPYLDVVLQERDWSWAVIAILYVLAAYFVRGWFMNGLSCQSKSLDRKWHSEVKAAYLKYSFPGWIFFFLPLGLVILIWRKDILPIKVPEIYLYAGAGVSYVFSIIFHLQAFGLASIEVLKKFQDKYKEAKLD